jgi:hypothetical protein
MTTHQLRRAVFTFAALVIAGTTLGAPAATAASALHARIPNHIVLYAPIPNHIVRPDMQLQETNRAIVPHFPAAQSGGVCDVGDNPMIC